MGLTHLPYDAGLFLIASSQNYTHIQMVFMYAGLAEFFICICASTPIKKDSAVSILGLHGQKHQVSGKL